MFLPVEAGSYLLLYSSVCVCAESPTCVVVTLLLTDDEQTDHTFLPLFCTIL